jgi:hypothetical protein
MRNLSTIAVSELSYFTNSLELKQFIATLKSYNILNLEDLHNISVDEFCQLRGVGDKKIQKLESVKKLLEDNLEIILSSEEQASNEDSPFSNDAIEELKVVPIDYLTSTLIEEKDISVLQSVTKHAKVNNLGELCALSKSTLMNTPYLGITKVQRVIAILNHLQDAKYRETIIKGYNDYRIVHSLPSTCSDSLANDILQFICEYIDLHKKQNVQDITAKCIELIFLHGYTIKNAAKHCGKDQERVRQSIIYDTHPSFFNKIRQIVFGKIMEYDKPKFTLSEEFRVKLYELSKSVRSGMLKSDFAQMIGLDQVRDNTHKEGALKFLNELLDFKVFSGEVHNTRVTNDYLINGNINDFREVWGLVFKTLDSYVKTYIKEELINLIQKKHPNIQEHAINTVIGIIESDKELFIVTQEGLATKYQLRWDALQSMQSRIERILYEQKRPIQKQEINAEYDRRIQIYGLEEPNVFHIKSSKNIFQQLEGGTWIWAEYASKNKTISLQSLIRQYVAQKQKFLFDEIMEHIRTEMPNANERSVKTLVAKYCITTSEGYYIDRGNKDDFSDLHKITSEDILPDLTKLMNKRQEYTYDELYKLYGDRYKISIAKSKIRTTCDNNPNVFIVIRGESRRVANKVRINPEWDGKYKVKDRKRGIIAEWKQNVREELINKLRYSPNYEMRRSELCKLIKSFIPNNVNETGVYKIFDDNIFVVNGTGREAIVALNIQKWEVEFKQSIDSNEASMYKVNEQPIKDIQQKESDKHHHYNISRTDDDINHLLVLTKSFISHNLDQLNKDEMSISDIDKVWSYMITQMRVLELGEDNAYYRMLNQLYGYLFDYTRQSDRYYLWVEIRFNFEPYLKSLLKLNGFPIVKTDGKDMQLFDLITLCQSERILPNRDMACHISHCIGNMLNKRNFKGHNAENTPNDAIIIQNIQKCITLYLYTTMQFMMMQKA